MDFTSQPIVLPDLPRASQSPDDGPWCPVIALKFYLDWTHMYKGSHDQLFFNTQKPIRPVSKQTIARWIVDVIKASVVARDIRSAGSHVRAHDVRSQASAWASYKGASLQEVMDAMGWSSSTTFQKIYLKDVLATMGTTAARVLSVVSKTSSSTERTSKQHLQLKRNYLHLW